MIVGRIIYLIFNVYALGLLVYIISSWIQHPQVDTARKWLGKWYLPFLIPLRNVIKPIKLGTSSLDITPMILLCAICLIRELVRSLFVVPF